jgi:carboxymethylenebutenolidase
MKGMQMGNYIELTAADGFKFPAYVTRPTGHVKGAVVVLQEIFGVNAHIRKVVDDYAALGFVALAPATFHRIKPDVELGYTPDDIARGVALKAAVEALHPPGLMQDIQAAVDYAATFGKVGVVGYCWGGLLAWRSGCLLTGISATVPYYGGGMTAASEVARRPVGPMLAHFSDHDSSIPLEGVTVLQQLHPDVAVYIYPASHGFNCDHRSAYDAAAAALARDRTLAFFTRHLA